MFARVPTYNNITRRAFGCVTGEVCEPRAHGFQNSTYPPINAGAANIPAGSHRHAPVLAILVCRYCVEVHTFEMASSLQCEYGIMD